MTLCKSRNSIGLCIGLVYNPDKRSKMPVVFLRVVVFSCFSFPQPCEVRPLLQQQQGHESRILGKQITFIICQKIAFARKIMIGWVSYGKFIYGSKQSSARKEQTPKITTGLWRKWATFITGFIYHQPRPDPAGAETLQNPSSSGMPSVLTP